MIFTQLPKKYIDLLNLHIQYCVAKSLPLNPVQSRFNPVPTLAACFPNIHFHILCMQLHLILFLTF